MMQHSTQTLAAASAASGTPQPRGLATHPAKLILTRSSKDRNRQFAKATRHRYFVIALRVLLPVLILLTASLYFMPHLIFSDVELKVAGVRANIGKVVVDRNALKMVNPRIQGYDEKQGAYLVTADHAVQDLSATHVVKMNKIDARLEHPDKKRSHLTADSGVFDTKSEVLSLSGNIRGEMSGQMTVRLKKAVFDMKGKTIESDEPVIAEMLNGTLRADSMYADTNRRILFFKGRVVIDIKSLHRATKPASLQKQSGPKQSGPKQSGAKQVGQKQLGEAGQRKPQTDGSTR